MLSAGGFARTVPEGRVTSVQLLKGANPALDGRFPSVMGRWRYRPLVADGAMLAEKLSERLRGARQKVVFFKAEDEAPYGEVVHLMDIARSVGAQTLAVVTE